MAFQGFADIQWRTGMKIATAKEVAQFLKLTESTVYTLAAEGKLFGFKIGNSWRFDMDEILRQIREANEEKTQKNMGKQSSERHKKGRGDGDV